MGTTRREAIAASTGVDPLTWVAICREYEGTATGQTLCAYCGERVATTRDHVVPLARGGKDEAANVVPACLPCNVRKGTRTWEPLRRHAWMESAA